MCTACRKLTSVEAGERKTNKTVSVGILDERLRHLVCKLNGLALDLDTSNGDSVSANNTSSAGTITVADLPLRTGCGLESGRLGRVKSSVLANQLRVEFGTEHPAGQELVKCIA
jgi:hypothetical protein